MRATPVQRVADRPSS